MRFIGDLGRTDIHVEKPASFAIDATPVTTVWVSNTGAWLFAFALAAGGPGMTDGTMGSPVNGEIAVFAGITPGCDGVDKFATAWSCSFCVMTLLVISCLPCARTA